MKKILFATIIMFVSTAHAVDFARLGKAAVSALLKDPESARFRNAQVSRGAYCGEVNAKNSYGGYVGYRRFIAISGVAMIDDPENISGSFDEQWKRNCWPKNKADAYIKQQDEIRAEVERDFERQRAEVRRLAAEREAQKDEADKPKE